jgi:type IV secretory pathway VirB2 component (pilin)
MRIVIRTSRTAIWARRLSSVALPLLILPVIMHRERLLDSAAFLPVILFAGAVAALTVLVSIIALGRLWHTGDQGWSRALAGLFLGGLCLAPFLWYASLAMTYPPVTDIATVPRAELPLVFEPDTATLPPPKILSQAEQQRLFPNATTRTYPLDIIQLFALVDRLVQAQGWDVRQRREPIEADEIGRINARIVTIPGWREEAVLRVTEIEGGSAIDMRSASIGAPHDFGSNGNRISDFLVTLDNEVTAFLRDNPSVTRPATVETEAPAVETGGDN